MSGQKRCHEDDSGRLTPGHNEFIQAKKSRVVVDSNYLALANTIDARLDTLTRRIEHMLTLLNNRLSTLESTVYSLSNAIETMQVTSLVAMDTGSPMDIGRDNAQSTHPTYYA